MKNMTSRSRSRLKWLPALFAGLLLGALGGAVVMLLFAPRAGKKTRSQIQKQGENLRRQATEGVEDAVTEAGAKAHEFSDSVQHSVKHGVDELQQNAQDLFAAGKK